MKRPAAGTARYFFRDSKLADRFNFSRPFGTDESPKPAYPTLKRWAIVEHPFGMRTPTLPDFVLQEDGKS